MEGVIWKRGVSHCEHQNPDKKSGAEEGKGMSSLITSFADAESKEIQWLWNPYIALEKLMLAYGAKGTS